MFFNDHTGACETKCDDGFKLNVLGVCVECEVLTEDGICMTLADFWEEEICQKENFANNDCIQDVWNTMKDNNVGFETLTNFLGNSPKALLCLDIQDLGNTINGNTAPSGTISNAFITINLNSQKLNRSKLSIARTMLHEMIHAELLGYVVEAGGYDAFQAYAQQYNDSFLALWNYMDTYDDWQHEYMATHYIQQIADGLKELYPELLSQGFINYANNGELDYVSEDGWSWDDLFYYMAWEGLHETEQFQTDIVNTEKKEAYDNYRKELRDLESSTYECN